VSYSEHPMHSLKLCRVGRPVRVDSRAAGAWQAGVIPFHSFWVFEAVTKPRPYRARVQSHAPRLGSLGYAAHSSSRHSGVAALTGRNCHETMYSCGFHISPIKPMKMRSLPTEQSHCVHSFKLCIGSAMYISTLRCNADGQGAKRDLRQKTVSSGTIQGFFYQPILSLASGNVPLWSFQ